MAGAMIATAEATVDTPCAAYVEMALHWELIDDLLGGTLRMRELAERWLPKETHEASQAYQNRLKRSVLYETLKDTVERLAGKPFQKSIVIEGDVPPELQHLEKDVDGCGTSISDFGEQLLAYGMRHGLCHALVDNPVDAAGQTKSQIATSGKRPRFLLYPAPTAIGWRAKENGIDGDALDQVRLKECVNVAKGAFGETIFQQIRVYGADRWELWRKGPADVKFAKVPAADGGEGTNELKKIPLRTLYLGKTGLMTAMPPLEGLAWLNLANWQFGSDYGNILHFASAALLFFKGLTQTERDEGVLLGPASALLSASKDADGKYLEHSGKAIEALRQFILDNVGQMEVLGLQPEIRKRKGQQTATGERIDEQNTISDLQKWARAVGEVIHGCYELAAEFAGTTLPANLKVSVFAEFAQPFVATDTETLLKARIARTLSQFTYLSELVRRGLLPENFDIEEELARLKDEGPALGALGMTPFGRPPAPPGAPPGAPVAPGAPGAPPAAASAPAA